MVLGKAIAAGLVSVYGVGLVVPPFGRKLDRNIIRPIRDYNQHLN